MFEDCDFEIYESITKSYFINEIHEKIDALIKLRLEIQKIINEMMSWFYELMNETAEWQKEDQKVCISAWIELTCRVNDSIRRQRMKEAMTTLQKSKKEEAIQKRKTKRAAKKLVDQRNKTYVNWLASEGLDKNDDDELDEAKKYLEEGNLPMTTEDRLRELAPYGITHLRPGASPKERRRHH